MVKTKPKFLDIFDQTTFKATRHLNKINNVYFDLFVNFEKACVDYFKDVLDSIRNDSQTIHQNGNIHPITTETLTFISNVLPFDVIAGFISSVVVSKNSNQLMPSELEINLRREASEKNMANFKRIAYQVESIPEKKVYREQLADYFYRLFLYLNYNLKKKADCYQDQNLKYIFLLNNIHKIKKILSNTPNIKKENTDQCDSLIELFVLGNKLDLKNHYETEILNYKREYSKCWSKLMSYIRDLIDRNPFHGEKLKDKDRQILKDRFSGFNKEFEEIYEAQKRYYIPGEQHDLAEEIRQDNVLYVGLQYQKFFEMYSRYNFATNRDKYVKYTPDALNAMLREFFTAF
ncbi:exocyst complex component 7 [Brachionus plicatilis]|uniref:Exocyst complex component 7 n=1 Tax=Brachionus plicatilis TaxID=10195 RepID=A0A3M7Q0B2_BRAPC|nr:exocyst complex component 7 [Brachionus plicatilis]